MKVEVGDKVRLRTPIGKERYNIPWGNDVDKIRFMDGETVYTVSSVRQIPSKHGRYRVQFENVGTGRGGNRTIWSWSEDWFLSAQADVTDKVHNVLKGL